MVLSLPRDALRAADESWPCALSSAHESASRSCRVQTRRMQNPLTAKVVKLRLLFPALLLVRVQQGE